MDFFRIWRLDCGGQDVTFVRIGHGSWRRGPLALSLSIPALFGAC